MNKDSLNLSDNFSLDPQFYWVILLKYKKILIISSLLASFLVLIISKSISPMFQSSASLLIEEKNNNIIDIDDVYGSNSLNLKNNYLNTQVGVIKSKEIINRLVQKEEFLQLNSSKKPREKNLLSQFLSKINPLSAKQINNLVEEKIIQNLNVALISDSNIVELKFKDNDPQYANTVLKLLIDSYFEYDIDQKIKITTYASNKIAERLEELQKNLQASEDNLLKYKNENKLIDLGDIKNLKSEEIKSLSNRILKAEKEYQELQNDIQQIKLANGNINDLLSLKKLKENQEIKTINSDLEANEKTIETLLITYTNNHPKVEKAKKVSFNLRENLKSILEQNVESYAMEMANLFNFIGLSENELEKARTELQELEIKDIELQKYIREVDLNERIYASFLERLKETSEAKELQTNNAKILDFPSLPKTPIYPIISKNVTITFIISFILMYTLAIYVETFRNTINEPSILDKNGFDYLTVIPRVDSKKGYHMPINFLENNSSKFSESIKMFQTLLTSSFPDSKIFLITSPVSGEGKTTISLNLALSLAVNKRVLFLETDFRRPSLIKNLNMENKPGLTDIFFDKFNFSDVIFNIYSSNLDIICAGSSKKYINFIDSEKFGSMLNLLKQNYDYIILDTAPILPIADTLRYAQFADTNVFIVKSEFSKLAGLLNAKRKLESVSNAASTSVLNYFDTENANYYNYSNYGYYYKNYYNYQSKT